MLLKKRRRPMKRYNILVLVIVCMCMLAFTACASLIPDAPLRTPMPTAPPATYEDTPLIADDDETPEDTPVDLPAPQYEENPITVLVATQETLDEYFYYVRHEEYDQGNEWIMFTTTSTVADFAYIAIGLDMDEMYFYEADVVYALGEIQSGVPFVVNWQDSGGLPHRGVRFVGVNGVRYFYIGFAGSTMILEEFWPGVRVVAG